MACPLSPISWANCKNECVQCNELSYDKLDTMIYSEMVKFNKIHWNFQEERISMLSLRNLLNFKRKVFGS